MPGSAPTKSVCLVEQLLLWYFKFFFDRELRSGLSMSFILLLLLLLRHAFRQILILDKKTGKSYLGQENQKVLYWIRKPESLILDEKTGKSYLG